MHSFPLRSFLACAGLALAGAPTAGQRPLNLDFERPSVAYADRPWGWTLGWSAFAGAVAATFTLDSVIRWGGRFALRAQGPDSGATAQTLMLQLPAAFARGTSIELSGWARTESRGGTALFTLEAWRDRAFAAADTARVTLGDWSRLTITIDVPDDQEIHSIVIGLSVIGPVTVWLDDLGLTVAGRRLATLPATAPNATDADLAWLQAHATPLVTVVPGEAADDPDLLRVGEVVGDARVVGLGESTHGSREFFQVKHRILEYLVRAHGFRVFAIEANQIAVERVNAYVQGGPGSAADVLRVMFQVWNTESMVELVEWVRGHNARYPARPVRFVGYDMQDHRRPIDTLTAVLRAVAPALVDRVERLTAEYRSQGSYATPQVVEATRRQWSAQADTVWDLVSARRVEWLTRSAARADSLRIEWAVQSANLLRQAARFNVALSSPERDSLMAANLDWALRTVAPGARAAVWAHDVHVSRGGDPERSFNAGAQMGAHLALTFGYDYRAFTLLTWGGAYRATRSFLDHALIAAEAFPGPPGSVEDALHRLPRRGGVGWVVDLRPARTDAGGAWLRVPRPIRHVGYAAYDYGFELNAVLPLEFDGIVFIDRTEPSRILGSP